VGTGGHVENNTQYIRRPVAKAQTVAPHHIAAAGKVRRQPLTQTAANPAQGLLLQTVTTAPQNLWWRNPAACYPASSLHQYRRAHTQHQCNRLLQIPLRHTRSCSYTHQDSAPRIQTPITPAPAPNPYFAAATIELSGYAGRLLRRALEV
jgi:hypothetical protein